jgi:hypothetical protein
LKLVPMSSDPAYIAPGGDGTTSGYWGDGHLYEWLSSAYWAITTMTTIGYGDISALTSKERAMSCIVMMMGCCFFAWSTGLITSLLTDTPYSVARFNDTMDELNEFMASRGLNKDLIAKLKSFYMLKFPTMRIYDESSVLDGLPKGLARAVKIELFKDVLVQSPFFYGMDISMTVTEAGVNNERTKSVAGDICTRIKTLYKTQGLELTTAGEHPDAFYIVRTGVLSVLMNGQQIFAALAGDVVGEIALLGLSKDGRRMRSTICLTMCELCMIETGDLEDLLMLEGFRVPLRRMLVCVCVCVCV